MRRGCGGVGVGGCVGGRGAAHVTKITAWVDGAVEIMNEQIHCLAAMFGWRGHRFALF